MIRKLISLLSQFEVSTQQNYSVLIILTILDCRCYYYMFLKILYHCVAGSLYVTDNLDYEVIQQYNLVIRATESFSGVSSEVIVNVLVNDMNDCHPKFPVDSYNVSAPESVPVDTLLFRVSSRDNDTGKIMSQTFLRLTFEHVC